MKIAVIEYEQDKKQGQFNVIGNRETKATFEADGTTVDKQATYTNTPTNIDIEIKYKDLCKHAVKKASVVDNFSHSWLRDIKVSANGTQISMSANPEYAYKAYLSNLLTYSGDTRKSHLESEIQCRDEPHGIDTIETNGWSVRQKRVMTDKEFEMTFQPLTELSNIDKFGIDNVTWQFTYYRQDPEFYMLSAVEDTVGRYSFDITDMYMTMDFVAPIPSLQNKIQTILESRPWVSPIIRTDILSSQISATANNHIYNNIFSSIQLPDQLFAITVDTEAKNGTLTKNPFYFWHANVTNMKLNIDGNNIPPEPLTPDFTNDRFTRSFRELYQNISIGYNNVSLDIGYEAFKKGSTIWAWDLNKDSCGGGHHNHSVMQGSSSLALTFSRPPARNLTLVIMGVYRDKLIIAKDRVPQLESIHGVQPLMYE